MNMQNASRALRLALVCSAAVAATSPAFAGPKLFAYLNNSFVANGTTETNAFGNVDPFVVELFSAGDECLRIAVNQQEVDLEATLVAPDGRTWRDDDSNGSTRPLIKALTTKRGWHILRVSHFLGSSVHSDFTFQVWRAPANSALCSGATPPISINAANVKSTQAPAKAAHPGGTR
jgi:hypothetical protein